MNLVKIIPALSLFTFLSCTDVELSKNNLELSHEKIDPSSESYKLSQEKIKAPSKSFAEAVELDRSFYKKSIKVGPFHVVGSAKVNDTAMKEAAFLVHKMLGHRPDILAKLAENKIRMVVMAYNEMTCDIPEHKDLNILFPVHDWNVRARGLGPTKEMPIVSCGEENLLSFKGDPYPEENILIHEFAHAIHQMALNDLDPTFDQRLEELYKEAVKKDLWKGTYAGSNYIEYWAEGVQKWFDCDSDKPPIHNEVDTREELIAYDPALAKMIASVFAPDWRYTKPEARPEKESYHLSGWNFDKAPKFQYVPDKNFSKK